MFYKKKGKLFNKKQLVRILCFFFFCVCHEIRAAIRKMKLGKVTGPGSTSVELFEAPEDYGVDMITALLKKIYDTGQISPDNSKSIFIALPKEIMDNRV